MKVALLGPVTHPVPPAGYGPWEGVVANLADGLVAAGHQVTVFAAGGSRPAGRLVATVPHPLDHWPAGDPEPDRRVWEEIHIAEVMSQAAEGEFDVVHSHLNVHPLGYSPLLRVPIVTTLHGSAWNQGVHPALDRYRHLPFVSISDSERRFRPDLNYAATVHNGIPPAMFPPGTGNGEYLLFAGRMAPEKAPHLAIEVAKQSGRQLKLAGIVEPIHKGYFDSQVAPSLEPPNIEYLGSIGQGDLAARYGEAAALVMPLEWDEPFGMVVVEALMSGTPVIGWRRGALGELVLDGVTGFHVTNVAGAVAAVARVESLDRAACRADAVARFSVTEMATGYASVYESLLR